ncbi:MAG TPA: ATP-dependent RNA helicase [Spirochaetia bacterium]|nr:ATP-dependent RNA helicase [Spirochaetia bacterium]
MYREKERILHALSENQVIVVESPTGSGKTTQLPLILYEAGYARSGVVGVTQPRRIAAVSVSEFIRKQVNATDPDLVAYKIRFEDRTTPATRIKIMTDGILLQELKADYTLSQYSVVVVDEAHERSLNIDFILGLLKRILEMRADFKVIISSATINSSVFSEYFGSCPVVKIDTPMYPVTMIYDPPMRENDYDMLLGKITDIVDRIVEEKREGDVLIFLSGEKMIKDCVTSLYSMPYRKKLEVLPLYGRLSKDEQEMVFPPAPDGKIKVVVSTNITETSVTIDGITTVIDSGLAKLNYYNPRTFTESLVEGPISRASANQRRGRAGRTRPGSCYRLYRKEDFETRPLFTLEEIYRTDLSEVVLRMAEIGITDFDSFDFISPPNRRGIVGAVETLRLLDALDPDSSLSRVGRMMAQFPLLPKHSRMIVEGILTYPSVMEEVLIATSFLTSKNPFLLPPGEEVTARKMHHTFRDNHGDFVSYLKLYYAYRDAPRKDKFCERYFLEERSMAEIANIKDQLEQIVSELGVPILSGGPVEDYLCAVATGLIQFVCVQSGKFAYRSLTAERIEIHPGSVMFRETPIYIVAGEIVKTSRMYARSVSPLRREWLARISTELAASLAPQTVTSGGKSGGRDGSRTEKKQPAAKGRETTWQVNIGSRIFKLEAQKGKKKKAMLVWEEFAPIVRDSKFTLPAHYTNMKGSLVYHGREIAPGERISTLVRVARAIDPATDLLKNWPRHESFDSETQRQELCLQIPNILKLVPIKKSPKSLGFLALETNNSGEYWFRSSRSFHVAVADSLASLETLTDSIGQDASAEDVETIGKAYRRLSAILDES